MDIVFIRGLEVQAIIGIFEWERNTRQPVIIDLEMAMDRRKSRRNDDITEALDYKKVSDRVTAHVSNSEFQLVETLAESIAELIQNDFGVHWLKLSVGKPEAISHAQMVGVIIERGIHQDMGYSF